MRKLKINKTGLAKFFSFLFFASAVILLSVWAGANIANNPELQTIIAEFGYLGAMIVGIVGGLNVIAPFPPASLTPIFTAAGLSLPIIILMLAIGTTTADLLGYLFGKVSRQTALNKYPDIFHKLKKLEQSKSRWLLPMIFIYTAFVPLPNEAFLIPLAIIGVPLRHFIFPMIAGTFVYHAYVSYGVAGLSHILL